MAKAFGIFIAVCIILGIIIEYKTFFIILALLLVAGYFIYRHYRKNKSNAAHKSDTPAPRTANKLEPGKNPAPGRINYITGIDEKPLSGCKRIKLRATGMKFRMDNLMKLAVEDSYYNTSKAKIIDDCLMNMRHYQYCFPSQNVSLIPEPDNPYDPNAVKVVMKNQHLAYIKASDCIKVLKLIQAKRIKRVQAEISGGKYKIVLGPDDMFADPSEFRMVKDEAPFSVVLHLDIYAPQKVSESDT